MRHSYHAEQWLPYPIELLFAFFADPANLPRLMPAWQKARIEEASIVPPPRPAQPAPLIIAAGAGSRITLSFRPFPYSPLRIPWEGEIAEFTWNDHFCDRQLRGPFAYWNHCHRLRAEIRNGIPGTLVVDHVDYKLPYGMAGELAHRLILQRQIARIFTHRHSCLLKILAEIPS